MRTALDLRRSLGNGKHLTVKNHGNLGLCKLPFLTQFHLKPDFITCFFTGSRLLMSDSLCICTGKWMPTPGPQSEQHHHTNPCHGHSGCFGVQLLLLPCVRFPYMVFRSYHQSISAHTYIGTPWYFHRYIHLKIHKHYCREAGS